MKINVEFDLTPAEFRQSLGLPDVESFQRDVMSRIQQQMEAGAEGYDPWSLMQLFMQQGAQGMPQGIQQGLSQGMANFGNYQQMMMDMLRQAGSATAAGKEKADSDTDENVKPKASASAKSRQNRKP
ncbi:hypothetical protein SAMN05661010_02652 [Modicisalibacter muralis]|uniref:Uncharacterized protein n=1 Tax=Modicisalibacter muralis TaxID=119000 RepID=A0A1G9N5M4_9GAMM|nr:hypothetical protein [Halomonas muralis]SDL81768.1 hypothetical protein SAMN05661010_02652 [Halomonas muralis]